MSRYCLNLFVVGHRPRQISYMYMYLHAEDVMNRTYMYYGSTKPTTSKGTTSLRQELTVIV